MRRDRPVDYDVLLNTGDQPFVQRGLFDSPENAAAEMAREYVLLQVERYRHTIEAMESKHGMS